MQRWQYYTSTNRIVFESLALPVRSFPLAAFVLMLPTRDAPAHPQKPPAQAGGLARRSSLVAGRVDNPITPSLV